MTRRRRADHASVRGFVAWSVALLVPVIVLAGLPVKAATVAVPTTKASVAAAPTVPSTRKASSTTRRPAATVKRSTTTTRRRITKTTLRRAASATKAKAVASASTRVGGPIVAPAEGLPVAPTLAVVDASATTVPVPTAPPIAGTVATLPTIPSSGPAPTTPATPTTTTTTPAVASADFDIVVPDPGVVLTAGGTARFLVIVAPRSAVTPLVTFVVLGLPEGSGATMSPNPTSGATDLRITTPTNMIPATYNLRLVGTAGSVTKSATVALAVLAPAATTTVTTAPGAPVGAGAFAISVVGDGKRLRSGGAVSFDVTIVPGASFPGPVSLSVVGVPGLVSAAFTATPTTSKSVLWLSTTLSPAPGTYALLLVATSGSVTQTVPLVLIIE